MRKLTFAAAIISALSSSVYADIYKCGNIYQQTPCDNKEAQQVLKTAPTTQDTNAPKRDETIIRPFNSKDEIADKCLDLTKRVITFKDAESARIEQKSVSWNTAIIYVNAKNSYGAYSGPKMTTCIYKIDKSVQIISSEYGITQ